jgi:hypothetical protein
MPAHVELSNRARRDLRRLGRGPDRKPIVDALTVALVAVPPLKVAHMPNTASDLRVWWWATSVGQWATLAA